MKLAVVTAGGIVFDQIYLDGLDLSKPLTQQNILQAILWITERAAVVEAQEQANARLWNFVAAYRTPHREPERGGYGKGNRIFRGFMPVRVYDDNRGDSFDLARDLPSDFVEKTEWADGLARRVWIKSTPDYATITYCEGDVAISVHDTEETFKVELDRAAAYYGKKG